MLHRCASENHGTYESNGIAFNDENEVWWLETIGGHHWIAKKIPEDRVIINPNQFGMDSFDLEDAFGARETHPARQTSENSSRKTIWI